MCGSAQCTGDMGVLQVPSRAWGQASPLGDSNRKGRQAERRHHEAAREPGATKGGGMKGMVAAQSTAWPGEAGGPSAGMSRQEGTDEWPSRDRPRRRGLREQQQRVRMGETVGRGLWFPSRETWARLVSDGAHAVTAPQKGRNLDRRPQVAGLHKPPHGTVTAPGGPRSPRQSHNQQARELCSDPISSPSGRAPLTPLFRGRGRAAQHPTTVSMLGLTYWCWWHFP